MKTTLIVISLFSLVFSADASELAIDQAASTEIIEEIDAALDSIFRDMNTLNVNTAFPLFQKDLTFIGPDGSIMNYKSFIDQSNNLFATWEDAKLALVSRDIRIISRNLVIVSAIYKGDVVNRDGKIEKYPKVGSTFVLNKDQDNWTVLHFHESSLPPEVFQP